ncbi:MAG TPA: hypothetical protein VE597_07290 [Geminicoccaceae bacterium]|jgi:Asp/Glu/hydantoin racemase|nr:hypothetical protein [Geminicoccaceae bacterium]
MRRRLGDDPASALVYCERIGLPCVGLAQAALAGAALDGRNFEEIAAGRREAAAA